MDDTLKLIDRIIGHLKDNSKDTQYPIPYIRTEEANFGSPSLPRVIISRNSMYDILRNPLRQFLIGAIEISREEVAKEFEQRMVFIDKASAVPGIDPGMLIKTAALIEQYVTKKNSPKNSDNTGISDKER